MQREGAMEAKYPIHGHLFVPKVPPQLTNYSLQILQAFIQLVKCSICKEYIKGFGAKNVSKSKSETIIEYPFNMPLRDIHVRAAR